MRCDRGRMSGVPYGYRRPHRLNSPSAYVTPAPGGGSEVKHGPDVRPATDHTLEKVRPTRHQIRSLFGAQTRGNDARRSFVPGRRLWPIVVSAMVQLKGHQAHESWLCAKRVLTRADLLPLSLPRGGLDRGSSRAPGVRVRKQRNLCPRVSSKIRATQPSSQAQRASPAGRSEMVTVASEQGYSIVIRRLPTS